MDKKLDTMLNSLDEEIERKCFELQNKRHEATMKRIFMICNMLFVIVPVTLVFLGMSILAFITWAAIFILASVVILAPVMLKSISGGLLQ